MWCGSCRFTCGVLGWGWRGGNIDKKSMSVGGMIWLMGAVGGGMVWPYCSCIDACGRMLAADEMEQRG